MKHTLERDMTLVFMERVAKAMERIADAQERRAKAAEIDTPGEIVGAMERMAKTIEASATS